MTTTAPSPPRAWLRPQQHAMIDMITSAPSGSCTAIEAETGTGKGRASLVAAALSGRAVIATSTKALSHQYRNELPLIREHHPGTSFKVLSGRRAMGCTCRPRRPHAARCPWPGHLAEARAADVVITNFALLAVAALDYLPAGGLGTRSLVILDEAHEFAAPREREPEDPSPSDDNVYWQPHEIADLMLSPDTPLSRDPVRLSLVSASINAYDGAAPHDPFALVSAGIHVTPSRSHVLPPAFDWSSQLDLRHVRVPDNDWSQFALDAACSLPPTTGKLFIVRSHREKHLVGDTLAAYGPGFDVLLQSDPKDARPSQAADVRAAFNARPGICVVGTDTLMTGLDVPGPALSSVIICGPPNLYGEWMAPLTIQERTARLRTSDVLDDYLVPTRALRLAQAIGRGVRSTTDTATVLVGCTTALDDRIYSAAAARYRRTA